METFEHHGSYAVRKIGKSENGIHLPSIVTGKFTIYVNKKGDTIILRKQGDLKLGKLMRDLGKTDKEESVSLEDAARELGLKK